MKVKFWRIAAFLAILFFLIACDNTVGGAPSRGSSAGSSGSTGSGRPNGGGSSGGNPSPQPSYESIVAGAYSLGNVSYIFNKNGTGKKSVSGNIRAIGGGDFTWKVNNKSGKTYAATITQNGSTAAATFDTSGANYTVTIEDVVYEKGSLPPHEHNFSIEVAGGINPSCTQSGTKKLKCTGCDEVVDSPADALGHTPSDNFVKATGDEQNHHKYCSVCGEKVASEAHSFAGGKCSVCGYEKISPPNSGTHDSQPTQLDNGNWQLFAPGVTLENGGWHDVNKTGGDNDLCWAATSSNLVAWWQDLYIKNGGQLPTSVKTRDTEIFSLFKTHFGNTSGTYVNGVPWYFVDSSSGRGGGYLLNCVDPQDWNPLFAKAYKLVEDTYSNPRFTTIADFSNEVIAGLKKGAIGLKLTKSGQGGHAITLWGAEYNTSNQITAVYVTDSDDGTQASLKRYELEQKTDCIMLKNYSVDGWSLDKIHGIMILYAP